MFIQADKINKLPRYIFEEVNEIKMKLRRDGRDIIDFSMANPDGPTPQHIINKLIESCNKPKNHGYSISKGIYKLRLAICNWYKQKYDINLDPENEAIATMGSKEGYVHLIQAATNPGDNVLILEPVFPIHSYAVILAGANPIRIPMDIDDSLKINQEKLFKDIEENFKNKPKFIIVNFPHNPSGATVDYDFYKRLVELAKKFGVYIISDIAYAQITYDDYKTPSILEIPGAKDIAVESYTLSKTYNMAGWRVGFVVGNKNIIYALKKIKSWIDYGMYLPIQIAATTALEGNQNPVEMIRNKYQIRRDIIIKSFKNIGWNMPKPKASMFLWAKIPDKFKNMRSLEFSKMLLNEADISVSPGIGFGANGDQNVRISLIENENRIRQAAKNLKKILRSCN